jgi:hypothetical protein
MFSNSVITNAGLAINSQWLAGTNLNIDHVACGSGTVDVSALASQTALSNQKKLMSLLGVTKLDNGIKLQVQLTNYGITEAFTINQFGIWAALGNNTPVLVAIYQDSTGIAVPAYADMPDLVYTISLVIAMSNAGAVSVTISPSALTPYAEFEAHINDDNNPHGVTCQQLGSAGKTAWASGNLSAEIFYDLGTLLANRTHTLSGISSPADTNYHIWSGKITVTGTSYNLKIYNDAATPALMTSWKTDLKAVNTSGTITFTETGTYYWSIDSYGIGMIAKMI